MPTAPSSARRLLAADLAAAGLLLVGGWVHLKLYFDGYRSAGDVWLGRSFLANVVVSSGVAALLVLRPPALLRAVRVAGMGLAVGTLVAFTLSRRGDGIFNFRERGLDPSPEAVVALLVEIGAVLSLCGALVLDRWGHPAAEPRPPGRAVPLAAAVLVATVALGFVWSASADDDSAPGTAASDAVTISDFAFAPAELTVPVGTTVTWTNRDDFAHSVQGADGSFESEHLNGGATYRFTFTQAGTYPYICGIHPSMAGTVIVG